MDARSTDAPPLDGKTRTDTVAVPAVTGVTTGTEIADPADIDGATVMIADPLTALTVGTPTVPIMVGACANEPRFVATVSTAPWPEPVFPTAVSAVEVNLTSPADRPPTSVQNVAPAVMPQITTPLPAAISPSTLVASLKPDAGIVAGVVGFVMPAIVIDCRGGASPLVQAPRISITTDWFVVTARNTVQRTPPAVTVTVGV
ncbi:MAG: hypothetical protein FJ037_08715 [Chloroflexi bacterium]|nr:hypothetical protein [Chloroflexota bacterium]